MPTQIERIIAYDNLGRPYTKLFVARGWQTSPRVGGRLVLQALPYSKTKTEVYQLVDDSYSLPSGFTGFPGEAGKAYSEAKNQAYARFRGKLYQGSAALGVSIASYKQSREMIVKRASQITTEATELAAKALRSRRPHKDIADMVLEGLFGWAPLLNDIHASATTVIQGASETSGKISATGRAYFKHQSEDTNPYYTFSVTKQGSVSVRYVARYSVSNPNIWLSERAGLHNPAAVAWDLVPWSFLVNMFVNTGAIVNSITDFAGLSFDQQTTTDKLLCSELRQYVYNRDIFGFSGGTLRAYESNHGRAVGTSIEPPTLEFRIPEANWELAAIATSLMVQKVRPLGLLLQKLTK